MKKALNKISHICKVIFGYGIFISIFIGGLTFLGYLAAFIIGGETAALICSFIYEKIIPIIIYLSTVMVLLGIFSMYLAGEYALTPNKSKTEKKDE